MDLVVSEVAFRLLLLMDTIAAMENPAHAALLCLAGLYTLHLLARCSCFNLTWQQKTLGFLCGFTTAKRYERDIKQTCLQALFYFKVSQIKFRKSYIA